MWRQKPPLGAQLDFSHSLASGLILYWLMNEDGGNRLYDLSYNNNPGIITNMAIPATATSGWNSSEDAIGLTFDGSNDYVKIASAPQLHELAVFTLSMLLTPYLTAESHLVGGGFSSAAAYYAFYLRLYTTGLIRPYISDGTNVDNHTSSPYTLTANKTNHYAFVFDRGYMANYLNGLLASSKTSTVVLTHNLYNAEFNVGGGANWIAFPGMIHQLSLYNYALSPDQIYQLYLNPYGMFRKSIPAWFTPLILPGGGTSIFRGNVLRGEIMQSRILQ